MDKFRSTTLPDDVCLCGKPPFGQDELTEAFQKVWGTFINRPKSIVVELNIYRKYLPIIVNGYFRMSEALEKTSLETKRIESSITHDRANKRWTKKEDEALIDMICKGDSNIHAISATFGRSPTAIKNRVTELVGVRKLEQNIAGKFLGTINGEEVEGHIVGTVKKDI